MARLTARDRPAKLELGIGDDAAFHLVQGTWGELTTCDAMVEGVHFERDWCSPEQLGAKLAAVNLSDLAAMGGTPERAYLALALPPRLARVWVERLLDGLTAALRVHGARLLGGDTVASPGPLLLALTLQGRIRKEELCLRSGARVGDRILVTGELGGAAAGLAALRSPRRSGPWRASVLARLLAPEPRLKAGRVLAQSGQVSAMLDLSDGLGSDLPRLAAASRVGARIEAGQLPVAIATSLAARALGLDPLRLALSGGEDYELLFTCPPKAVLGLTRRLRRSAGLTASVIGEVLPARQGIQMRLPNGRRAPLPAGWEHRGRKA